MRRWNIVGKDKDKMRKEKLNRIVRHKQYSGGKTETSILSLKMIEICPRLSLLQSIADFIVSVIILLLRLLRLEYCVHQKNVRNLIAIIVAPLVKMHYQTRKKCKIDWLKIESCKHLRSWNKHCFNHIWQWNEWR